MQSVAACTLQMVGGTLACRSREPPTVGRRSMGGSPGRFGRRPQLPLASFQLGRDWVHLGSTEVELVVLC